jgi:hypothetical protein
MMAVIFQIPITAHADGYWQVMMEYCGKDGMQQEVIQCNPSARKDMEEEWQEHVPLAT